MVWVESIVIIKNPILRLETFGRISQCWDHEGRRHSVFGPAYTLEDEEVFYENQFYVRGLVRISPTRVIQGEDPE